MIFRQICTSEKRRNVAYIVGDETTREVAVVDAGFRAELILDHVEQLDARVELTLATHGHRDHIAAAPAGRDARMNAIRERSGAGRDVMECLAQKTYRL